MKKPILIIALLVTCYLMTVFTGVAGASDIVAGGQFDIEFTASFNEDSEMSTGMQEHLNLELYLPCFDPVSVRCELDLYHKPRDIWGLSEGLTLEANKLYLKYRAKNWDLSLGRQPVSWSFGSIMNPLNYGSSNLMTGLEETEGSFDGARLYVPLGWASGLDFVATLPYQSQEVKWGLRARTFWQGIDLSTVFVNETSADNLPLVDLGLFNFWQKRIGVNAKGDLGPFGVYGAMGHFFNDKPGDGKELYLAGIDYSFNIDSYKKMNLQVEYLKDYTGAIIPSFAGGELITGILGLEIDEFSSLSLMVAANPQDKSMIIVPGYKNQLNSSLDLNIQAMYFIGDELDLFSPSFPGLGYHSIYQITLSYPF